MNGVSQTEAWARSAPAASSGSKASEDALVLALDADLLGHGDGQPLGVELAAQQRGQEAAEAVGLDRDRRLVLCAQEGDHLAAELGGRILTAARLGSSTCR